jgi:hypothetical protein
VTDAPHSAPDAALFAAIVAVATSDLGPLLRRAATRPSLSTADLQPLPGGETWYSCLWITERQIVQPPHVLYSMNPGSQDSGLSFWINPTTVRPVSSYRASARTSYRRSTISGPGLLTHVRRSAGLSGLRGRSGFPGPSAIALLLIAVFHQPGPDPACGPFVPRCETVSIVARGSLRLVERQFLAMIEKHDLAQ